MLERYRCTLSSDKTQQVVHYILIDHQKEWREKWSLKWLWSHSLRLSLLSNCIHIHYCSLVTQKTKRRSDADITVPLISQRHHGSLTGTIQPAVPKKSTLILNNNNQPTHIPFIYFIHWALISIYIFFKKSNCKQIADLLDKYSSLLQLYSRC